MENKNRDVKQFDEDRGIKPWMVVVMLLVLLEIFLIWGVTYITGYHKADDKDIQVIKTEFIIGIEYEMRAEIRIENLEVTVEFLDKEKNETVSYVRKVGSVAKGEIFNVAISFTEMNMIALLNTEKHRITVTDGMVPNFG